MHGIELYMCARKKPLSFLFGMRALLKKMLTFDISTFSVLDLDLHLHTHNHIHTSPNNPPCHHNTKRCQACRHLHMAWLLHHPLLRIHIFPRRKKKGIATLLSSLPYILLLLYFILRCKSVPTLCFTVRGRLCALPIVLRTLPIFALPCL